MTPRKKTRRSFLSSSAGHFVSAGALAYFPWMKTGFANESANDRPRIACIGTGNMGLLDAREHAAYGDIVCVCDVDSRYAEQARQDPRSGNGKAELHSDYRKILDRQDVDVVSVVTCDHWHVKIAIEALQAGKHVFCQKPLSLTIQENQIARVAAKRYPNLQFFIGTQQRSDKRFFLRAVNMVQKGLLGDIRTIVVGIEGGMTGGPFSVETPPSTLNWDMWLGQTPEVSYREMRCHHKFRWWYEYSGGKFTDWGAHHVDIALWAIGQDTVGTGPSEIDGTDSTHPVPFQNGFPLVDDRYNTATDFAVKCRFPNNVEMVITSRTGNGIRFEGTRGTIYVDRSKITGQPIDENWDQDKFTETDLIAFYKGKPFEKHKQNFYRCIREGGLPVSDVYSHTMTMNTCHLAAIATRLKRVIRWDPVAEKIIGDDQAATFLAREPRKGYEIHVS